jgi:CHAT domain-containing protein
MGERLAPPTALRRAQAWLRQASSDELASYAKAAAARGRIERHRLTEIEKDLSADGLRRSRNSVLIEWAKPSPARSKGRNLAAAGKPVARPYAHPYFWAGFILTGL